MSATVISLSIADWLGTKVKDPRSRPFAVIAKSSDVCNYRCTYCYVEDNSTLPVMPLNTARVAIVKLADWVEDGRKLTFIWHGGEPLLAKPVFFEGVLSFTELHYPGRIDHCIQTNGSHLTDDFLALCAAHGAAVSLSFDGPEEIHDLNRIDSQGRGTHRRTLAALAIDEVIEVVGRATIEAVLNMSAEAMAGPKQAGKVRATGEARWYGRQAGQVYLSDRK